VTVLLNPLLAMWSRLSIALPIGSLRQRYLGGTFWLTLGTGLSQIATFVSMVIAARLLGSVTFGEFGIIQATLGIFSLFAGMGMGVTNRRYVAELRDKDPIRCGQIIQFSSIATLIAASGLTIILIMAAPYLAERVLNAPHLSLALRISAGLLLMNALNEAQIGALSGLENFRAVCWIYGFRAALTLVFVVAGVWLWGLPGMLLGMAGTAFTVWFLTRIVLKHLCRRLGIPVSFGRVPFESQILRKFTVPAVLAGFLPAIVFWIARAIIVRYPRGYAELGVFTAADQWTLVLAFIPSAMNNVAIPVLSNIYGNNDIHRFRMVALKSILAPICIATVFAGAIAIASPWIPQIYGKSFDGMSKILLLICLVGILRVNGGAIGALMASLNQMWWGVLFNMLWGASLIISTFLLADRGALGLAFAYLIAYLLHSVWGSVFLFAKMQSVKAHWLNKPARG
jgi:O-antigen/teichoic acid export membrane protein